MTELRHRNENLIIFQANGEGFKESFDLYSVERLLPEYRRLLDASYRQITGLDPNRKRIRSILYNSQFELGCFDVLVDIAVKATPTAGALLAVDGGGYHLAKMSFQLISKILELRKKVKELLDANDKLPNFIMNMQHASLVDSLVAPILISGNNNTVTVAPAVYMGALASHGAVNRLAKSVDGNTISDVNLQHAGVMGEVLTVKDRGIAEASLGGSQQEIKIAGRLDAIGISTRSGYLVMGEAKYPIEWASSLKEKLMLVIDKENAVFTAIPIADYSTLTSAPVRFRILDCWIGQLEL